MPRSTISSVLRPTRLCVRPSICATIVPALGRTMPMMHFMSVLLPLPLVPSSATVSASFTLSEMPCSTCTEPYPALTSRTWMLFAKVGLHDFHVVHDRLRRVVGDLAACNEHCDAIGELHDRAHDVLDHDDGHAVLLEPEQQREDVVGLGSRQSRHGFVRDEQHGFRRDRARELELAHVHLR